MNHSLRPLSLLLGCLLGSLLSPVPLVTTDPPQGTLHGTVVCPDTRQPLAGVTLTVLGRELSTVSGADGTFTLSPLPVGGWVVRLELGDVQPVVVTDVIVKPGRATEVTLEMPLLPLIHEAVTVRPQYFASPHTLEGSRLSLAGEEIRRGPGAAGDVSRIVLGLPSLAKVSDQQNILAVRGGSSYENLFLIDRIVVPNIHHFPAFGGTVGNMTLPYVDFIQDVTFLVGGFPARFGGKSSAVMDIQYREGRRDRTAGQLTLDMGGAGAALEGPLP
ncbi:MAG TPA: carboxypeptidase-like regulatory domain-containing protein, partial [Candidatus Aminicenantes bacterium]|nr:carboxypeptidase-like regulatory domain-containing protein [Candidatus Aminicenantes bacterium]